VLDIAVGLLGKMLDLISIEDVMLRQQRPASSCCCSMSDQIGLTLRKVVSKILSRLFWFFSLRGLQQLRVFCLERF
jgi:hypothetical protein